MKATTDDVRGWAAELGLVSSSYFICFILSFWVLFPLQQRFLPSLAAYAMLFFFPHGVRIIAAWLYGARSVILLFPAALISQVWLVGPHALSLWTFIACLIGVSCGALAFQILETCNMHRQRYRADRQDWVLIIAASVLASLMNSIGTNWFLHGNLSSALAYLVGDVSGTVLLLALLTYANRLVRKQGY